MTDYKHAQLTSHGINKLISFLQVYGIILVVVGHSEIAGTWLETWIYQFHMPLFIFISGFLMKYSLKTDYRNIRLGPFIKSKIKRLLIPYFIISTIALGPKILMNSFALRPVELSWLGVARSFVFPWDNTIVYFWFLPTLFIIFVIAASSLKLFKSHIPIAILMAISFGFQFLNLEITKFLNLNGVIIFFLWWGLGFFYAKYEDKIKSVLRLKNHFVVFLYLICTLIPVFIESTGHFKQIFTILGILLSLSLGYLYIDKKRTFLDSLDGYSYSIYLFSWFPQIAVRIICLQMLDLPFYVFFVLSVGLGIWAPVLLIKIVKATSSNKFLKYVCGI